MKCPYYDRVNEVDSRRNVRGYCDGYLAQGMMIPSIMEEKRYCLRENGCLQCPIYLSRQMIGQGSEMGAVDLCFTILEDWRPARNESGALSR